MKKFLSLFSTALLVFLSQPAIAVVGGETVSDQDWPFTVSLRQITDNGLSDHRCGGAYIGDGLVLTAAHCVDLAPADESVACIGGSGSAGENNCFKLFESIIHPDYDERLYIADLALYRLSNTFSKKELPSVAVITEQLDAQIQPGERLQILGLGSTSYESYTPAYQLQGADIEIADETTCNDVAQVTAPSGFNASNYLCGGEQFRGPAPGDSGTPAFVFIDGQYHYAALVSHGYNYMGIFTRLGDYLDWIEQVKADLVYKPVLDVGDDQTWFLDQATDQIEHTQVITNHSDEEVTIEEVRLQSADTNSAFGLVSHDCTVLTPSASCSILLTVERPAYHHDHDDLIVRASHGDEARNYYIDLLVYAASAVPGIESWEPAFQNWTVGNIDNWTAIAAGIEHSNDSSYDSYLRGTLTGPATLSYSAVLTGASGYTQLSVFMDGNIITNLSGNCVGESMQITIPEGEHTLKFHFKDPYQLATPSSVTLTDFTLLAAPAEQAQLRCSYQAAAFWDEGDDVDAGGSTGLVSLLALLGLALTRRKIK
ncbi:S1 family peptidase [Corallincola platygyrae]|uniref:S1 family peptidase n=1 Tax=Corallincola platygyrae TaxID=1193278 RepID=A0ABW4XPZ7_9GAMM